MGKNNKSITSRINFGFFLYNMYESIKNCCQTKQNEMNYNAINDI